jgi:hypothetical protein
MQTSENTPSTSSVHRGYVEVSPSSLCPRFFVEPTRSKTKASASEIEAALRVSISVTIKTRVIYRSA